MTFFTISGFIMVRSTAPENEVTETMTGFLAKRIVRVVPLYWLSTIVYFTLSKLHGSLNTNIYLLKSFLFLPYLRPGSTDMRPIVGQGWTLNYEMFFYVVFGLCLFAPRKLGAAMVLVGMVCTGRLSYISSRQCRLCGATDTIRILYRSHPAVLRIRRCGGLS